LLLWRANDGALLGCVRLEPIQQRAPLLQHEPAGAWYLSLLAVDPRQQKQQLGRTLLAAAEAYARTRGARRIRMSVVFLRDTLIAWYLRRGYTLTGETEPFPYGDERFGRPLRDDLHFVILEKELQS
jgi:GNAT superfamily N-acetyltransferase